MEDRIVSELPVMKRHCKTCPFKPDKTGKPRDVKLCNKVTERTLFKAQQICHGTEDKISRKAKNRCKGSYDYNFEIYKRLGMKPELGLK